MAQESLVLRGTMRAHTDWVTAIATPIDNSDMIVTSSRDKSIIVWSLTKDGPQYGVPRRRLTGHGHFVEDVVLSSDGMFALSGSWDGELRLWDLQAGTTARRFVGHTKDVLSVAFSVDNRQIVSASRDKTIKLWNTLGECKYTIQDQDSHSDWVSCVRFSPNNLQPTIVSGSWDRTVKIDRPSTSSPMPIRDKFCCLSREDIIRFVIGCLGALAPIPLSSIYSLGIINSNYCSIEASRPAIDATQKLPKDPPAVAVIDPMADDYNKIIGEISATKLWKCDYLAAAWALANFSAGQFVMGVEDNITSSSLPHFAVNPMVTNANTANSRSTARPKKFSSRSIGFVSNPTNSSLSVSRSMYRGRSAPLTCKETSSLAAVMAQMLSHRATHVWVTDAENEDHLVGVVGYADILAAVTKPLPTINPEAQTS